MRSRFGVGLVLPLVCAAAIKATARASEPPIVAVFDLQAKRLRLKRAALRALSDFVADGLAASGAFRVIPRDQLQRRLRRQKLASYKRCYDQACQIELGRELAAQKSLATRVMRLGGKCVVTATLYDLRTATTERGATAEGRCGEAGIMASLKRVIATLAPPRAKAPPARPAAKKPAPRPGHRIIAATFDPRRFDALGFYPRALKLARAVHRDALLVDFDVEGVFPDGRVDLALNAEYRANYTFRSPARSRRDPRLPKNVAQERKCLVHVEVSAKQIEVYPSSSIDDCKEKPRPRWRCSLTQAWALARKGGAPKGNVVAKVSWLWDGWYFDFGDDSLSVSDACR